MCSTWEFFVVLKLSSTYMELGTWMLEEYLGMIQLLLFQKVESDGGPFFKVAVKVLKKHCAPPKYLWVGEG